MLMARVEAGLLIGTHVGQVFAYARDGVAHPQLERPQFDVEQSGEGPMGLRTALRRAIRFLDRGIDWALERRIGLAWPAM
jgi:hypothetical protein